MATEISVPELIETIFVNHASEIEGIKNVYPQEPGAIDRKMMPALAMWYLFPEGVETATGLVEDVNHAWEISLYVALDKWNTAAIQIRDLSWLVTKNFRQHREDYSLDGRGDLFARFLRRRTPPQPDEGATFLRGSWELQVTAGEQ